MESKWFIKSKTVWGLIITGAAQFIPVLAPMVGFEVSSSEILQVGIRLQDAFQVSIYFRDRPENTLPQTRHIFA